MDYRQQTQITAPRVPVASGSSSTASGVGSKGDAQAMVSAMLGPLMGALLKVERELRDAQEKFMNTTSETKGVAAQAQKKSADITGTMGMFSAIGAVAAGATAMYAGGQLASESTSFIGKSEEINTELADEAGRAEATEAGASTLDEAPLTSEEESEVDTLERSGMTREEAEQQVRAQKALERRETVGSKQEKASEEAKRVIKAKKAKLDEEHQTKVEQYKTMATMGANSIQLSQGVSNALYSPLKGDADSTATVANVAGDQATTASSTVSDTDASTRQVATNAAQTAGEVNRSTAAASQ